MNFITRRSINKSEKCSICGRTGRARTRAAGVGFQVVEITCDRCECRGKGQSEDVRFNDVPGAGWASIMALG